MSEFDSNKTQEDPLGEALNRWANDSGGYRPLDTAKLETVRIHAPRRVVFGLRAAATLAAAAMFLFALGQISFTVSLGDTTLRWGVTATDDVVGLSTQLAEAESRIVSFENQLMVHAEAINTVAIQNALLNESLHATAIELAQRQDFESAARVYDMQSLAQFVSLEQ